MAIKYILWTPSADIWAKGKSTKNFGYKEQQRMNRKPKYNLFHTMISCNSIDYYDLLHIHDGDHQSIIINKRTSKNSERGPSRIQNSEFFYTLNNSTLQILLHFKCLYMFEYSFNSEHLHSKLFEFHQ